MVAATRPAVAFLPSGIRSTNGDGTGVATLPARGWSARVNANASAPAAMTTATTATATAADVRRDDGGGAGGGSPETTVGVPSGAVVSAARAARITSPALAGRCAGSLASARRSTSSSSAGSPGRASVVDGGGSKRCAHSVATSVSRRNGARPVSASKSTQPNEYTSDAGVASDPSSSSGAT